MPLTKLDVFILCLAIINTAADDFNDLRERGVTSHHNPKISGDTYNLEEIEDFFNSEWADQLVQDGLGLRKMTGADIFKYVKRGVSFEGII